MIADWVKRAALLVVIACIGLAGTESAFAGTTGKIAGTVIDKTTKQPLIGATVQIKSLTTGAAANQKGEYFIINIPPGTYAISVSMVGYASETLTNVRVYTDATTTLDFQLSQRTIETKEVVEVVAERPLYQKDITGSRSTVTSEEIAVLPVQSVSQALDLKPGLVEGHFRGGRLEEQRYFVDGIDLTNEVTGQQAIPVDISAIEEIQAIMGGYNAEYGQALSGIVNLVTKKGGSKFSGSVEVRASVGGLDYDHGRGLYGDILGGGTLTLKAGEMITLGSGKTIDGPATITLGKNELILPNGSKVSADDVYWDSFQVLGDSTLGVKDNQGHPVLVNPSFRNFGQGAFKFATNEKDIRVSLSGPLTSKATFFGSVRRAKDPGRFPNDDSTATNVVGSVTYKIQNTQKITLGTVFNDRTRNFFDYTWKYNPNGTPTNKNKGSQAYLTWDNQTSAKSFYNVRLSWQRLRDQVYVPVRDATQRALDQGIPTVVDKNGDGIPDTEEAKQINYGKKPGDPGFLAVGAARPGYNDGRLSWLEARRDLGIGGSKDYIVSGNAVDEDNLEQDELRLSVDYTSQVTTHHQVKTGVDYNYMYLHRRRYFIYIDQRIQPDLYDAHPRGAAFYVQDKMEFEGIIVNLGLRFDYFHPSWGELYFPDQYGDAISPPVYQWDSGAGTPTNPNGAINAGALARTKPTTRAQWSPRLGLSFPITPTSRLRFSYGQFFQRPRLQNLFQNLQMDAVEYIVGEPYPRPVHGNPNLDAERSTQYEVGFDWSFLSDYAVNMTAFRKNISGLVDTRGYYGGIFQYPENSDYATIRGIDAGLEKRLSRYWLASVSETYSFSRARAPSESFNTLRSWFEGSVDHQSRLNFLPWDRRHNVKARVGVTFPDREVPLSRLLSQVSGSMVLKAVSGFPYTDSKDPAVLYNRRGPWKWTIDMSASKGLSLVGRVRTSINLQVFNLTNRRNLFGINDLEQYRRTGDPRDPRRSPYTFDPPRTTYVSLMFGF